MFLELRAGVPVSIVILSAILAMAQHPSVASADQTCNDLAAGNHRFVVGNIKQHDFLRERKSLTKTQHPRVAVLSSSDSRVPPELVFDAGLGEMFVVRSAGEDVDPESISLEYAVERLGSVVIVVMGIKAAVR
jgi:carbonic anhydrase